MLQFIRPEIGLGVDLQDSLSHLCTHTYLILATASLWITSPSLPQLLIPSITSVVNYLR